MQNGFSNSPAVVLALVLAPRKVARLTGETLTEAVRRSLAERLTKEQIRRGQKPFDQEKIDAITKKFQALPVVDARSDDEILGYDENGLPS